MRKPGNASFSSHCTISISSMSFVETSFGELEDTDKNVDSVVSSIAL